MWPAPFGVWFKSHVQAWRGLTVFVDGRSVFMQLPYEGQVVLYNSVLRVACTGWTRGASASVPTMGGVRSGRRALQSAQRMQYYILPQSCW